MDGHELDGLDGEGPSQGLEVDRAKALDPEVWSSWFDEYYPFLFRYAVARLGSRDEAEDVVSQVFLNAMQAISHYQDRGRPVLAWLYRIAHNLVADRLRAQPRASLDESTSPDIVSLKTWPESSLDALLLKEALAKLKSSQREVIVLRYYSQLSIREVSTVLRKSESAVQSLQVRGIESLRRVLHADLEATGGRGSFR